MATMTQATQNVTEFVDLESAKRAAGGIVALDGCFGAMVSGGSYVKVRDGREIMITWGKVQSLHEPMAAPLPDGCRNVWVPHLESWIRAAAASMAL